MIGLLGGTFDPVHLGHVRTVDNLLASFSWEAFHVIPCHRPVHKPDTQASATARLAMLKLALPQCVINPLEINRKTPSYTITTLQTLRKKYPKSPLVFVLGQDAFNKINQWHEWDNLLNYSHFLVINRPGYTLSQSPASQQLFMQHQTQDPALLQQKTHGLIVCYQQAPEAISSQAIRAQLQQGNLPAKQLPPAVTNYIQAHGLYGLKRL